VADATYKEGDEVHSGSLYRRIFPDKDYYKGPPQNRPTSANFMPGRSDPYLSMYRAAETTPSEMLAGHDRFGLCEIDAEVLWGMGLRVTYEPTYGKGHVGVWGFTKKNDQARRDAAYAARVLIPPTL
jgi:hypothetical protein